MSGGRELSCGAAPRYHALARTLGHLISYPHPAGMTALIVAHGPGVGVELATITCGPPPRQLGTDLCGQWPRCSYAIH